MNYFCGLRETWTWSQLLELAVRARFLAAMQEAPLRKLGEFMEDLSGSYKLWFRFSSGVNCTYGSIVVTRGKLPSSSVSKLFIISLLLPPCKFSKSLWYWSCKQSLSWTPVIKFIQGIALRTPSQFSVVYSDWEAEEKIWGFFWLFWFCFLSVWIVLSFNVITKQNSNGNRKWMDYQ